MKKRGESIFSHLLGNKLVELNHVNNEGYTPLDIASGIKRQYPFSSLQVIEFAIYVVCRVVRRHRESEKYYIGNWSLSDNFVPYLHGWMDGWIDGCRTQRNG